MRILSWNINGIRTLPKYHPWNTCGDCEGILDALNADIICFQEMKSSRQALPKDVAVPPKYGSFFSFPAAKGGYSGVAVYTRSATVMPLKAEEGVSGTLQPKPQFSAKERISSSYPSVHAIDAFPDEEGYTPASFDQLDSEGRGLVLDFGLFVLINVYCPNETSDARTSFKMNYHLMLEERVRILREESREVIVLGDMNICATPMDHCDGHLPSNASCFWEHPARAWFHMWLHPLGPMVDVVRSHWPDRKGMFTCWNMKIQARETNYGTRVDYILVTPGLLKWIKHGDIQPSLKGSDHCPIYIDLRDEITLESGDTLKLCDVMQQGQAAQELPRIAAKHWGEFSEKQTKLSTFFGKKVDASNAVTEPLSTQSTEAQGSQPLHDVPSNAGKDEATARKNSKLPPKPVTKKRSSSSSQPTGGPSSSKKAKKNFGQAQIGFFFQKTAPVASYAKAGSSSVEVIEVDSDSEKPNAVSEEDAEQLEADYRLACELATQVDSTTEPSATPPTPSSSQSKAAWTNLFVPVKPPKCTVHGEPAKKFTVNKAGPNKGRSFFVCSRPVGPGYDKGKGERLREEVDHTYKCNYFKWASEVKRDAGGISQSSGA
ncbi:Endonuclease/exonuclease/phosphatase [Cytidiella melzeri]|nr:Endonuclease/exonuclease/phosphatase [Cytidiella melzeri]